MGGPGNPDYTRGNTNGEVKDWNRPMGKTDIQYHYNQHGSTEFTNKGGFSPGALNYVDRYHPEMNLFHKTKKIR